MKLARKIQVSRLLQGIVVGVLLVVAAYVSIGRILLAGIDQYRTDIEEVLSEALQLPVAIAAIDGELIYLDPDIKIQGMIVGAVQDPAVEITLLSFRLDVVASLMNLKPLISELDIKALKLAVEKNAVAAWGIRGFPDSDGPFNIEPLLDLLDSITLMSVEGLEVDIIGHETHYKVSAVTGKPIALSEENGRKSIALPLMVKMIEAEVDSGLALLSQSSHSKSAEPFLLTGLFSGHPADRGFKGDFYLQLPLVELIEFIPNPVFQDYALQAVKARGEFWLTMDNGQIKVRGLPEVESVIINSGQNQQAIAANLKAELSALASQKDGISLFFKSLSGKLLEVDWQLEALRFAIMKSGVEMAASNKHKAAGLKTAWQAVGSVPSISLGDISRSLDSLGEKTGLLSEKALGMLERADLSGEISDLMFVAEFSATKPKIKLTAQLVNISAAECDICTSVSQLDGFVSLTPEKGFFDIHNEGLTELRVPGLFAEPWLFDAVHARLYYENKDEELHIYSGLVEAKRSGLIARGKAFFKLPKNVLDHTWGLELGVINAPLLDSHRYLPKTVAEELRRWLNSAILGGVADQSGMVFHGSLATVAAKDQKVYQIYFQVHDVILDYDPQWPRFDDLHATIYVSNRKVYSANANALVFDSEVFDAEVLVPVSRLGVAENIIINGQLRGPFSDGLRMLTETPLFDLTGEMASGWVGDGKMSGRASLTIPLATKTGSETLVNLKLQLDKTDLFMPQFNLHVAQLTGLFNYGTHTGLDTEAFSALVFDEQVAGRVDTKEWQGDAVIQIDVAGSVSMANLYEWSDQLLLTRADGEMDYQLQLNIPMAENTERQINIDARSNLLGVDIDMPFPMGKSRGDVMPLVYRQQLNDTGFRIDVNLGEKVKTSLKIVDEVPVGGLILFGEQPIYEAKFDQLRVTGRIDKAVYSEWEALSEDLIGRSSLSLERELASYLEAIDVNFGVLDAYGFEVDNVQTYITKKQDSWEILLNSKMLQGTLVAYDDGAPLDVKLDYVKFEDTDDAGIDPLMEVDPVELMAVDFSVSQLYLGDEDYGSWAFNYRPHPSGSILDFQQAAVKGLKLEGDAQLKWTLNGGIHSSEFSGAVLVPDLATALEQWGYASSIEGQGFEFGAALSWSGSPAMVDLERVAGMVEIKRGSGRFVQADSNVGALKLLGIFDFASLSKRFRLDFSDVVESGFSFNSIQGSTQLNQGIIDVVKPIVVEGPGSIFKVAGRINLPDSELDNDMVVTLPLNRNLPWYAAYSAIAMSPLTGAGVFLAQRLLKDQINAMSSAKYKITGSMEQPVIEFVSIFDASLREMHSGAAESSGAH